jgi:hypothetical protein
MLTATSVCGSESFSGCFAGGGYIGYLQTALCRLGEAIGDPGLCVDETDEFDCNTAKAVARLSCYLKKYLPGKVPGEVTFAMDNAYLKQCFPTAPTSHCGNLKGACLGEGDEAGIIQAAAEKLTPLIEQLKDKIMAAAAGAGTPSVDTPVPQKGAGGKILPSRFGVKTMPLPKEAAAPVRGRAAKPWYKTWKVIIPIAGAAALGAGAWWVLK